MSPDPGAASSFSNAFIATVRAVGRLAPMAGLVETRPAVFDRLSAFAWEGDDIDSTSH
jgi:hypothetical protein